MGTREAAVDVSRVALGGKGMAWAWGHVCCQVRGYSTHSEGMCSTKHGHAEGGREPASQAQFSLDRSLGHHGALDLAPRSRVLPGGFAVSGHRTGKQVARSLQSKAQSAGWQHVASKPGGADPVKAVERPVAEALGD